MPKITTGRYDPARIKGLHQRIERQLQRMLALADAIDENGFGSLVIRHRRDLVDGMDGIEKWNDAGERALRNKINGLPDEEDNESGDTPKSPRVRQKK